MTHVVKDNNIYCSAYAKYNITITHATKYETQNKILSHAKLFVRDELFVRVRGVVKCF